MRISRRSAVSIAVLIVLGLFAGLAYWYETQRSTPASVAEGPATNVTNGDDRGPGSLREALFIAAAASGETTIAIQVPTISLTTTLPPLVNSHGIRIVAAEGGTEIDASALPGGAVLDVAGPNVTIEGVHIRNCSEAAILLRAEHFRLVSTTVEQCDVGVEVAENASQVLLERNRFVRNRIGVRLAASNPNTAIVKNEFDENRDAGVWAVRGEPDLRDAAISLRDNRFTRERIGVLAANLSITAERNELLDSREAAMQFLGVGPVARGNRISGGASMGFVAEDSRGIVIESNELDGLAAYGIMIKNSADALVRDNRVYKSGYGLAFVTDQSPSTAIGNTIIEPQFNGIDVIGASPILRNNHVLRPRALALKVVDFDPPDGPTMRSDPFLEGNNFDAAGTIIAERSPPADETASR